MSIKEDAIIAVRTGKTVYKDGNTVLKVFSEDFCKSDILNEALNHARVEEAGVNVPKLLEVTVVDGKWAIRSEYIEGKTLQQLMEENPEKKDEYLKMFVDIQSDIFAHKAPLLNQIKDKMKRKIGESGLDATARYELQARLGAMPTHKKICHGDFNPSNIIIKADGTPVILDWSHATQGNASADAARTYLLFKLANDTETAEKYLKLFCTKNNIAKQYVQQWMPIVAASQLSKGNADEHEFLIKWVDVIEFE